VSPFNSVGVHAFGGFPKTVDTLFSLEVQLEEQRGRRTSPFHRPCCGAGRRRSQGSPGKKSWSEFAYLVSASLKRTCSTKCAKRNGCVTGILTTFAPHVRARVKTTPIESTRCPATQRSHQYQSPGRHRANALGLRMVVCVCSGVGGG
jgi:hypothetical protein